MSAAPLVASNNVARGPEVDTAVEPRLRTIRVGIIGLGQVGQAVARLVPANARLAERGLRLRLMGALVRDINRPRRCPKPLRLTTNPAAFLRGNYDVVIEVLGTVEPARTLVQRLLGRGIPVVTANKALVAQHGAELAALAVRRDSSLRYEASALAGVPFLGALAARPLVSDVQRFTAIVNSTSNFILSKLDAEACSFADAVSAALRLGLTEPNPSRDVDGLDAADKLSLLSSLFGWGPITHGTIDVQGIRDVAADDLAAARWLNATIKPIVHASRAGGELSIYIGPTLIPARHALASLSGTLSGIQLSGRLVSDLFFSGPGAGPDITAATLVDDAVEAVTSGSKLPRAIRCGSEPLLLTSPKSEWFVRARFPSVVPDASVAQHIFAAQNLEVLHVTEQIGDRRWVRLGAASREQVSEGLTRLRGTQRIHCHAIRAI